MVSKVQTCDPTGTSADNVKSTTQSADLEDKSEELDPDGIHFSLMAGILFVQDLHDQAVQLMLTAMPDPKIR